MNILEYWEWRIREELRCVEKIMFERPILPVIPVAHFLGLNPGMFSEDEGVPLAAFIKASLASDDEIRRIMQKALWYKVLRG